MLSSKCMLNLVLRPLHVIAAPARSYDNNSIIVVSVICVFL